MDTALLFVFSVMTINDCAFSATLYFICLHAVVQIIEDTFFNYLQLK